MHSPLRASKRLQTSWCLCEQVAHTAWPCIPVLLSSPAQGCFLQWETGLPSDLNVNCKVRNRQTRGWGRPGSGKQKPGQRKHRWKQRKERFVSPGQGGEIESEAHFPLVTRLAGNTPLEAHGVRSCRTENLEEGVHMVRCPCPRLLWQDTERQKGTDSSRWLYLPDVQQSCGWALCVS